MLLQDCIRRSIAQRAGAVVLSADFAHMASASQVARVLARLVQAGVLVRVSKGAYAKARPNRFTGQPSAAGTLESIAAELFAKLKIDVQPCQQVQAYNAGQTTQVPMCASVSTGQRRITRKITVGQRTLTYENHTCSTQARH
ncbi:MAG: S-adenosylhomocysteine hydrolase [Burkholderiaceae bacterium]|nr:S-adenosylhomocysteine hydrolase [Burkholderiaceae bacterium]